MSKIKTPKNQVKSKTEEEDKEKNYPNTMNEDQNRNLQGKQSTQEVVNMQNSFEKIDNEDFAEKKIAGEDYD